ncbi:E3 ubiquitin-protein ligase RING1 [Artemisia annua]|uniref:RING-type E3 ubiquitin transferase n=1 Tax=Artemisia annua TaxID=35608 RepID=A0A2U1NLF0_ARTAN|nr:E3 ubiquitin-protein ligase RING1 [Artemisia annua]
MSHRLVSLTQTNPSFIVQFLKNLHRSIPNRQYFQQLVEMIPSMPHNLLNLIIERSYENVLQIEEEEIVQALAGLQEENNNIGASGSSRAKISNKKIILLDKMEEDCSICLEEFKENQTIRTLICQHEFHVDCIETWLYQKNVCPLCRNIPLPI